MIKLSNITKTYTVGEEKRDALHSVSLSFRDSEFVCILGASGSGKTTLLNIVGGLDRYTDGDILIDGVSTKEYKDSDWDIYRNSNVGFVFQNYSLIPHIPVLDNVKIPLTLAGLPEEECRKKALEVLKKVGLEDETTKKPNQLSGGQMQRVAIARALVNDPKIVLADEPTGALDSATGKQVMDILKEISKDRLVVTVTHNSELASKYATRIIKLSDGHVTSDTMPVYVDKEPTEEKVPEKARKPFMSFKTALSLSLNNLLTKKGRTILTSVAGSIGIAGIALVLSFSSGVKNYIARIQRDTLTSYPVVVTDHETTINGLMSAVTDNGNGTDDENVGVSNRLFELFGVALSTETPSNNLVRFKAWIERETDPARSTTGLYEHVASIHYQYKPELNVYVQDTSGRYRNTDFTESLVSGLGSTNPITQIIGDRITSFDTWTELMPGQDNASVSSAVYDQYELLAGEWPDEADEIVLITDTTGQISDIIYYALGFMDDNQISDTLFAVISGGSVETEDRSVTYDDIFNVRFKLVMNSDCYVRSDEGTWRNIRYDETAMSMVLNNASELRITGVVRPKADLIAGSLVGGFGYTAALTDYIAEYCNGSEIVTEQLLPENSNLDITNGLPFEAEDGGLTDYEKAEAILEYFESLTPEEKTEIFMSILADPGDEYLNEMVLSYMEQYNTRDAVIDAAAELLGIDREFAESYLEGYSDAELQQLVTEQLAEMISARYEDDARARIEGLITSYNDAETGWTIRDYSAVVDQFEELIDSITDVSTLAQYYDRFMPGRESDSTLAENLASFGYIDYDDPSVIRMYVNSFDDKNAINDIINEYNSRVPEEDRIHYTDYMSLLTGGVSDILSSVTYGLVAFVSIALLVSSIMIGIITYISVLERTSEIGILRSVGASKRDIARVFNAETALIGAASGVLGTITTIILNIPVSHIVEAKTGISGICSLPAGYAVILILVSILLTLIAGYIPSKVASNKDPVTALRSE
ncbi:MAG: ABC transporter ATP-binding protein/permease [Clostridiales bacterium]|nr:ABC transporter ATP-binding protein/permease [Clostridiales bacterium]